MHPSEKKGLKRLDRKHKTTNMKRAAKAQELFMRKTKQEREKAKFVKRQKKEFEKKQKEEIRNQMLS